MIYSVIPCDIIFNDQAPEISYIKKDGIILEMSDGTIRRIISTNPFDYMQDLTFSD